MKALTLRQPWAWLVVHGGKSIENRTWNTKFRGEFLIHAASGMTRNEYERAKQFVDTVGCFERQLPKPEQLVRGALVGQARLVAVRPPIEVGHGWQMPGQYGFVLEDVKAFDKPIACAGALGFWNYPTMQGACAPEM